MKKKLLFSFLAYNILFSCSDLKTKSHSLIVKKVSIKNSINFESVSKILEENAEPKKVDWLEWKEFPYKPKVSFRIAHSDSLIFLKYYVKEEHILAKQSEPNTAVHRDSCVEFFIDLSLIHI